MHVRTCWAMLQGFRRRLNRNIAKITLGQVTPRFSLWAL